MAKKPPDAAPAQVAPPKRTQREMFIDALTDGCSISEAAKAAGAGRRTVYDWRKADVDFGLAWDAAVDIGTDALEDEAIKRAKNGSDTLLIFMLKARRPKVYRDRMSAEITGADGQPLPAPGITLVLNVSPSDSGN